MKSVCHGFLVKENVVFWVTLEVVENVKDTIRKAAPGGGYILTSSNSSHPGCKYENVITMFRATMEYGTYPIKIDEMFYQ